MISSADYFSLSHYQRRSYISELVSNGIKPCPRCKRLLSLDAFHQCFTKNGSGKQTYCKECKSKESKVPDEKRTKKPNCQIVAKDDINNKVCSRCEEEKPRTMFTHEKANKDGLARWCNPCKRLYEKENKERIKQTREKYKERDAIRDKKRIRLKRLLNPEWRAKVLAQKKAWDATHKEHNRQYSNQRYHKVKNDPRFKLSNILRRAIKVKGSSISFSKEGLSLIGCSPDEFVSHLQKSFASNESWIKSIGCKRHHLDHIIPCKAFDLENDRHKELCFNYRNFQVISASENASKSDDLFRAREYLTKKVTQFGNDDVYVELLIFLDAQIAKHGQFVQ